MMMMMLMMMMMTMTTTTTPMLMVTVVRVGEIAMINEWINARCHSEKRVQRKMHCIAGVAHVGQNERLIKFPRVVTVGWEK